MEAYKTMAEQEQVFKVTDRRSSMAAEPAESQRTQDKTVQADAQKPTEPTPQPQPPADEPHAQAPESDPNMPLPEANLLTLMFSLYTHTQICLGLLPDPVSQQPQKDLIQAQYNIDMLAMLKEKTAGNLTPEEEQTLESVLYEVRMAYVGAKNKL